MIRLFFLGLALLAMASFPPEAMAESANARSSATVVAPLSITQTSLAASSAKTVSASSLSISPRGVAQLSRGKGLRVRIAALDTRGEGAHAFSVTTPASIDLFSLEKKNASPIHARQLSVSSDHGTAPGQGRLAIEATFFLNNAPEPGGYGGDLPITIEYN